MFKIIQCLFIALKMKPEFINKSHKPLHNLVSFYLRSSFLTASATPLQLILYFSHGELLLDPQMYHDLLSFHILFPAQNIFIIIFPLYVIICVCSDLRAVMVAQLSAFLDACLPLWMSHSNLFP